VATPQRSLDAAAAVAREHGVEVVMLGDNLEGEARELGALQCAKGDRAGETRCQADSGSCPAARPRSRCAARAAADATSEYLLGEAIAVNGARASGALRRYRRRRRRRGHRGRPVQPQSLLRARAMGRDPKAMLDDNDGHSFFAMLG